MPDHEYKLQPRTYGFDLWKRVPPIVTPLGDYECELMVERDEKPDQTMIDLAEELGAYVAKEHAYIASILVTHLHRCAEDWGEEVYSDVLPEDISDPADMTGELLFQIYNGGRIGIGKSEQPEQPEALVSFEVPFDPEHGLCLDYRAGGFVKLNDSGFFIANDALYFEGEEAPRSGKPGPKKRGPEKEALIAEVKQRPAKATKAKKFVFSKEHQDFTDELQEALIVTLEEMKRELEKVWRTFKLTDECRVILQFPDGWSFGALKHYVAKHSNRDDRLIHASATSLTAVQMQARMIRDMQRALEFRQWPPPPFEPPECSVLRELRLEIAAMPKAKPAPLPAVTAVKPQRYEQEAAIKLQERREANNYIAPTWWLKVITPLPNQKPTGKFVKYLARILKCSIEEALTAYKQLATGESVEIPLTKRAEWGAIRHDLKVMGIEADLTATY